MKSLIKFPKAVIRLSGLRVDDFGAESSDSEAARLMDERQIWTAPTDGRLGLGFKQPTTGNDSNGKS